MTDKNAIKKSLKVVNIFHNVYTAWVVLAVSLALTIAGYFISSEFAEKRAKDRFEFRVKEISDSIKARMHVYEQVLWGGVALFDSKGFVSRSEFRDYIKTLNIGKHWPGIQGIGFSVPIQPRDKELHIESIRSEGFQDYSIRPEGIRDLYTAIIYLEPFDWRNKRAFGYDMWSNEMRRRAMKRSRDEGVAATSGVITLVQETKNDAQRGFLTYLPVYKKGMPVKTVEERRHAFLGWVYSPFRAGDLMQGILGSENKDYDFEIYDEKVISNSSLLYDSNETMHQEEPDHDPYFNELVDLTLQGRLWQVYIHTKKEYLTSSETFLPKMIAGFGFVVDGLLFYVIMAIYGIQRRAVQIASEMTNELELQQKELLKKNQDLEQFAMIAAHDLKEPLVGSQRYASFLNSEYKEGDVLDKDGIHAIEAIEKNSVRMKNLVLGLMDYAKINCEIIQREDIDMEKIIQELKESLHVEDEGIELDVKKPLPHIQAYPSYIRHIFQNLISNAIKYNQSDQKHIEIGYQENGVGKVFYVKDNGIGIPREHQEVIFNIFSRLHGKSEFGGGSGVGLTITRKMVEKHDGEIWVESHQGQGSTFNFTLGRQA